MVKKKGQKRNPEITIVIPAFNEEGSVCDVASTVLKILEERYPDAYQVVIIDDASTDATLRIARELAKKKPQIKVFENPVNYGKNQSLLHAFQKISSRIVCFIDADKQYYPEDLPLLIEKLRNGADIVGGYRSRRNDPFYRKIMSFTFNQFNRTIFSIKIHDINCGMKGFRYEKYLLVQPQYNNARWFFDTELLARASRLGLHVDEAHIQHRNRAYGRSKVNCVKLALETLLYATLLRISFIFKGNGVAPQNKEETSKNGEGNKKK